MEIALTIPDALFQQLKAIGTATSTQDNYNTADPVWLLFDRTRKREERKLMGIFLSEKACQKWLSANKHHFQGESYIKIDSLWRNGEMQAIRQFLMLIAKWEGV